jgi:hypothetical protein
MTLPIDLVWGVDVAIKKLRPNSKFTLTGTTFTEWNDPSGLEPPTWDEVLLQIEKDKQLAEEWANAHSSTND